MSVATGRDLPAERATAWPGLPTDRATTWRERGLLLLATLAGLLPFVNKAVHVDDPLFLWAARRILQHPLDPYGYAVNWYGTLMPASDIIKNPPLGSYLLAVAGALFGWGEVGLHLVFFLPALAAVLGTYELARGLCPRPLLAALVTLACPVFLISATGLMCDVTMLALFVWAIVLWRRGLERDRPLELLAAALVATLAALAKYFGVALLPLLAVYTLARHGLSRRSLARIAFLLVPLAVLAAYQLATRELYGRGLLLDAAGFSLGVRGLGIAALPTRIFIGLAFAGGCALPLLFTVPTLRRRYAVVSAAALALSIPAAWSLLARWPIAEPAVRALLAVEMAAMAVGGVYLLGLAGGDLRRRRDADAVLLGLWVVGTLVFASLVNWTTNGRSLLPLVPAAGVLLARRLGERTSVGMPPRRSIGLVGWGLASAAVVALMVTWADYRWAASARGVARGIVARHGEAPGRLWFEGHWGFQWYMEEAGAYALDFESSHPAPGDRIVVPENNASVPPRQSWHGEVLEEVAVRPSPWIATMRARVGAGFYSEVWGPLPFVIAPVPSEHYGVARVVP